MTILPDIARVRHRRGKKLPPNTKLVARPSRWGNPYQLKNYSRKEVIDKYEMWLKDKLREDPKFLDPLKGFDLACYCPLDEPCHADSIIYRLKARSIPVPKVNKSDRPYNIRVRLELAK